jgi:hypothetical protein
MLDVASMGLIRFAIDVLVITKASGGLLGCGETQLHAEQSTGAEALTDLTGLRGPEGPLFPGSASILDFFRSLTRCIAL